jgi:hypothetical protein
VRKALRRLRQALKRRGFSLLGLLLLAELPPVLLGQALGLGGQAQLILDLAWSPAEIFFCAWALRLLAVNSGEPLALPPEPAWRSGLRWLLSDLLLSARLGPVALLGLLPGAFITAWMEPQDLAHGLFCASLLLAGLLPALVWLYYRCLSPCLAVLEAQTPANSLDLAPARMAGRHARAFWLLGILGSASLLLGHVPDLMTDGWPCLLSSALCLPFSSLLMLGWMLELYQGES